MLILKHVNNQIFVALWSVLFLFNVCTILGDTSADSWLLFAREAKKVIHKCLKNNTFSESWSCMQHNSLDVLDDMATIDTIPLTNSIRLIRRLKEDGTEDEHPLPLPRYVDDKPGPFSWSDQLRKRIIHALSTHHVQFALQQGNTEARGRRRRGQLFPAMIFGIAILGVVTVPIGFHVMSVISGMALLFSKMALLLATITANSKRLPVQGSHVGHYQSDHFYNPGPWERYDPKSLRT